MTTSILAVTTLALTIMAFVFKNAILHLVCVIAWLVFGFAMYNQPWPTGNTYLGIAFMLLSLSMVIVNLIIALNHYLGQRTVPPTHEEIQSAHRIKVLQLTTRKRRDYFDRDEEQW